jgi:hypothetical protein
MQSKVALPKLYVRRIISIGIHKVNILQVGDGSGNLGSWAWSHLAQGLSSPNIPTLGPYSLPHMYHLKVSLGPNTRTRLV